MISRIRILITTLEAYFNTDIRYLIKGGGALMVGQVGVTLIGVATSTAFANLVSKETYGTYQYIITTAEFLATFSLIGLSRAVVTSTSRGYDGTLGFGFRQGMLWGIPCMLLGLTTGGYYFYHGNTLFALGIAAGTTLTLIIANAKIYISFLNGKGLFGLTSSFTVAGLIFPGIASIITLFLTNNLFILIAVYFISNTAINVLLYEWSKRYAENNEIDPALIPQSVHLSAQGVIGRIAANVDRLLLFHFAGPIALAEFTIAANIQRNFSHLYKSANSVVLPKLSVRSYSKLRKGLPSKILLLYAFIIPFTIGYMMVLPPLVHLLFPQYISAIFLAQILGLLFLFLPIQILADALVGHSKHRALYKTTVMNSSAKLAATCFFVPLFGAWGIVISTFIEQLTYMSFIIWYFFKEARIEAASVAE